MTDRVDAVVIGAGVVGLAVARALALRGHEVRMLEAERAIGTGTSSRNSEVIHAGIYYPTGWLKARLCVTGRQLLYPYCEARGVPHRPLGKLIVATSSAEEPTLGEYLAQAQANGVEGLELLTRAQVRELEPAVRCVAGLRSPRTGIIDSQRLMLAYQGDLEARGGTVVLGAPVIGGSVGREEVRLEVGGESPATLAASMVVNAAGLGAQAVSRCLEGVVPAAVPERFLAKGHYYSLSGRSPFSRLVYPVATAGGLGTHVTLDLQGRARFGPDVTWIDHIDYDFDESRREAFAVAICLYWPDLDPSRLQPAYTGIRPKISGPTEPAADFCIVGPDAHGGCPYVALYGIESPGLTSSLAMGDHVAALLH